VVDAAFYTLLPIMVLMMIVIRALKASGARDKIVTLLTPSCAEIWRFRHSSLSFGSIVVWFSNWRIMTPHFGKVAVINGGNESVWRLLRIRRARAAVVVTDLSKSDQAVNEIAGSFVAADASSINEMDILLKDVKAKHGRLDTVICNAKGRTCAARKITEVARDKMGESTSRVSCLRSISRSPDAARWNTLSSGRSRPCRRRYERTGRSKRVSTPWSER
jgi:hypothetical protein